METQLRYPEGSLASLEDFHTCGWKAALESDQTQTYSEMWHSLSIAARKAIDAGKMREGKVLWLLADACSMSLRPQNHNEPFKPMWISEGRRSTLPEDFKDDDLALLIEIVEEVDNYKLKARLADLIWLLQHPRNPKMACVAIDEYRMAPIESGVWSKDGRECWERAISLSLLFGATTSEKLTQIKMQLINSIQESDPSDGFLGLWISQTLEKVEIEEFDATKVAERLELTAKYFQSIGELLSAREYFEASTRWYRKVSQNEKAVEMLVCIAETWVEEANNRASSPQPSHMVIASFLESAIHAYRRVPNTDRPKYQIDEKISVLHSRMNDSGKRSLDEMGIISSGPIDISKQVEFSRKAVQGKTAADALVFFANIHQGEKVSEARKVAEEILKDHVVLALFSSTFISKDGRVVARRPGANLGNADAKENEEVIWAEMVKNYGLNLGLAVQSQIWPALEVLLREHRFREEDFIGIANQSSVVPPGRARLFGKALFQGFERDFVSALHLITPQLENLVRWHLKRNNVKTTTIDSKGIENELGLSSLAEAPQLKDIFGEDFVFELRALFCDSYGANLRNELSHGLLEYDQCRSVFAIYAWWFFFKIVFNIFWNETRANLKENPNTSDQQSSSEKTEEDQSPT